MDIPITPRTQALLLRYEHDRPVIKAAARDALIRDGQEGYKDIAAAVLHPYDPDRLVRTQHAQDWSWAFHENERFAAALLQKEAELGIDHLPMHLFGCAPLVLMLHLASCLPRRPLRVYQQALDGLWSLGHDRAQPPSQEDFFQVEGLPTGPQGGRGHVALIVEVTRSIRDKVLAEFQARHPSELLATVCLRPLNREPSPTAVRGPGEVSRAVVQFRAVLDALHERLGGTQSVLLAMDCPASFAAALATAINPHTQHPLWLHHFNPEKDSYLQVHRIHPGRRAGPAQDVEPTREQLLEASRVLSKVREVHRELVAWLGAPEQQRWVELLGGLDLLESRIHDVPSLKRTAVNRHVDGTWTFDVGLLLGLEALRQRLGSREDWEECIRLFFVHEAYHVRQGGPTSYSYSGSGRTGWVLEAVDYDADEVSVLAALAFRQAHRPIAQGKERSRLLQEIVWNVLEFMRVFEPERPMRTLSERRLRRYLIWLFHACRLGTQRVRRQPDAELERVTIEITGLRSFPDPHESYSQPRVHLEEFDRNESLSMAVYHRHRLAREQDTAWVKALLQAISQWDSKPREEAQEAMSHHFERFFAKNPELLKPRE